MDSQKLQSNSIKKILGFSTGWRLSGGVTLIFLATISGLLGLWLFPQEGRVNLAWFFYFCSVVIFVIGLIGLFGRMENSAHPRFVDWKVTLTGIIIFSLAVFMRLYLFSSIPFGTWYDEADIGLNALKIVDGIGELPVYYSFHSQPLHFTYLVSLAFRLFGVTTLSIRMVTVIFGLLAVMAAFLLGTEIKGTRFGLILAFLFAVGRWHVTFSRLGLSTITTPFFVLITFYFLFRAMRKKMPLDFGLSGVALGLGLDFHTTFRVIPIAVVLFFIYCLIRSRRVGSSSSSPRIFWIISLAVFLLGTGLTVAPVAQYAIREPEGFWDRTTRVSIFQTRDEPDLTRALLSNAKDHFLMFNYKGDRNGRHNLPGEPMLDPISAVLFVLGLGLALFRINRPTEYTFLIIFIVGLSAGIFSVDFESPQAQRSVAALPAVYYFISLAFESVWKIFQRSGSSQIRRVLLTVPLLMAGGGVVYLNAYTYFKIQANDPQVWGAHNPAETLTGIALRELDSDKTTVYLSMFLQDHVVIRFLAPDFGETKTILPPDVVPLREPGNKSVALFIDKDQGWVVDEVQKLYAGASRSVSLDPAGNPALYKVLVPKEDIKAIQGLTVKYWQGTNQEGEPSIIGTDKTLEIYWPEDSPYEPPFIAEWDGVFYIPNFGQYQIRLESPVEAKIWMDEELVLQKDSVAEQTIELQMAEGNHTLRVQAVGGDGIVRLAWRSNPEDDFETIPAKDYYLSPPVYNNGLIGSYYEGGDWDSPPKFVRIDPFIDMYFHLIPLPRPYSVEWEGEIEIPTAGEYEFGLRVNGQAQLFINNELIVDAAQPTVYQGGKIFLDKGGNRLRLRFLDYLNASRIHLYWTKPGDVQSVIPSEVLFPKY